MTTFPLVEITSFLETRPARVSIQCARERNYLHMHGHIQLCYVLSGTLRHIINGKEYMQTANSCAFILPYMHHMTDLLSSEDTPIIVFITFKSDFLNDYGYDFFPYLGELAHFEGRSVPVLYTSEDDTASGLVRKMLNEFSLDLPPSDALASDIASLFRLACGEKQKKRPTRAVQNRVCDIVCAAEYISKHFTEKISIDDVACLVNMSRSTFTKNFKTVTGKSFQDFLAAARLKSAMGYTVSHPRASADEIAKGSGLHDRTNMIRVFKRYFGMTPNQVQEYLANGIAMPKGKSNALLEWLYEEE